MKTKSPSKGHNFAMLKKLQAAVVLMSIFVIIIGGFMAGVSLTTLCVRAMVVWMVVAVITRVAVQILVTNEEMGSGKG